jgi:uncharacterized protein YfbU (UPF0304 family)
MIINGGAKLESVIEGAEGAPSEFRIKQTPHAFMILSSGLYSDKVTAVLREIICNAYDAMISAKKAEVPFEVHLPTILEPYFEVKDFGIGLSHQHVMQLYTTYFDSLKNDSNEVIGGLGLGSKSPFAYTRGFTVTSVFNGTVRIYSALISEDNIPVITLMETLEAGPDECNGLTVNVPVKSWDIDEFKWKAERVLEFFPTAKVNRQDFHRVQTIYSLESEGQWGLRTQHYQTHGLRAVMGNVSYKFTLAEAELTEEVRELVSLPLDLYFQIGDLDVAASRETLDLNKRTRAALTKKFLSILPALQKKVMDQLNSGSTIWEKRVMVKQILRERNGALTQILRSLAKKAFRNVMEVAGFEVSVDVHYNPNTFTAFTLGHRSYDDSRSRYTGFCAVGMENYYGVYNHVINVDENVEFWVNDTSNSPSRISMQIFNYSKKAKMIYVITPKKGVHPGALVRDFQHLMSILGDPEVKFTSDLPPVEKVVRPRQKTKTNPSPKGYWSAVASKLEDKYALRPVPTWSAIPDASQPKLYVEVERLEPLNWGTLTTVKRFVQACSTLNLTPKGHKLTPDTVIFFLNVKAVQKVKKQADWIELYSLLEDIPEAPENLMSVPCKRDRRSLCTNTRIPDYWSSMLDVTVREDGNPSELCEAMNSWAVWAKTSKSPLALATQHMLDYAINRDQVQQKAWEELETVLRRPNSHKVSMDEGFRLQKNLITVLRDYPMLTWVKDTPASTSLLNCVLDYVGNVDNAPLESKVVNSN